MTSDLHAYRQVFVNEEYRMELARKPVHIIDGGANIGLSAIYFANQYPEARILAVEPEAANYALLKKNAAPYPNIIPIQAAISTTNEAIDLIDPGIGPWGYQTQSKPLPDAKKIASVQGMTIKRIMADHGLDHVDILKLDIEGAEKEVFENSAGWLEKVGVIVVELHDRIKPGCSRAYVNATNDLGVEWFRGEHAFIARKDWVETISAQAL